MASNELELMFGDFEDLSPEEHTRIYQILHRQKADTAPRVEFPWDCEQGDTCITFGGDPPKGDISAFSDHRGLSFQVDGQFSLDFCYTEDAPSHVEGGDLVFKAPDYHHANNQGVPSKLQASLKPYERRNKKKRPPNYYANTDISDTSVSEFCQPQEENNSQLNLSPGGFQQEIHSNVVPGQAFTRPPPGYSLMSHTTTNFPTPSQQNFSASGYPGYQASQAKYVSDRGCGQNQAELVRPGAGHESEQSGELCEVIVMPNNSVNIPARTETFQVQDHDRTTQPLTSSALNSVCVSDSVSNSAVNINHHPSCVSNFSSVYSGGDGPVGTAEVAQPVGVSHTGSSGVYSSQTIQAAIDHPQSIKAAENLPQQNIPVIMKEMETAPSEANNCEQMYVNDMAVSGSDEVPVDNAVSMATAVTEVPKPKPVSWAGLFKSGNSGSSQYSPIVYKIDDEEKKSEDEQRSEKECSPLPVPAAEDSVAKQLGEMLSQMTISHTSVHLQPRGLVNKGNWCYINGTLQALVACPPFYNLLKKLPRYPALSRGPSSTPILDSMVEFIHEFQLMPRVAEKGPGRNRNPRDINPGPPLEPTYVYRMLQTMVANPHFKLGKQEDAEEFLSCILDGMHEEMSAAVGLTLPAEESDPEEEGYMNGYSQSDTGEQEEEEEVKGSDDWEQVGPKKKSVLTRKANFARSPIADIFAGMMRSAVYKASCKETATLEPFFTLQLDIQSEKVWSVMDALNGLVSKEQISGYTCSKTNTEVEVLKKLSVEELPTVLILHLKCFVYNKDGGTQKLMKKVDYTVDMEITRELLSQNVRNKLTLQQRSYKLFAVVYHHGKALNGGHYTTNVFHPGINGWINLDDSTVKTVSVSQVLKYLPPRVPYLLYYRRLDSH